MTILYADTPAALMAPAPPGSVIMLKRGQTYRGPIVFASSGTAAAHIRITAYGTGAPPLITGNATLYSDALTIKGSYVDVDGLSFADTNRSGVQIPAEASHVTLTNSDMARVGQGVGIAGTFVTVTHCTMHDLTMVYNPPVSVAADKGYGANGFVISGSNVELAFNRITHAKAPSFDYGEDGGGFELYALGPVSNINIHDNWVEDSAGFIEGGGAYGRRPSFSNISVTRNVSRNNGEFVVLHNAGGAFGAAWTATTFANNTIIEEAPDPKLVLTRADGPMTGITYHHNIFWMKGGDSIWKQPGADYHHDNLFALGTPKTTHLYNNWGMALSPGEIIGDPRFVDPAHGNFALQPGSPALGMGAR